MRSNCEGRQDLAFRAHTGFESDCEDVQRGLLEGMIPRYSMYLLAEKLLYHHGCWTAYGREKSLLQELSKQVKAMKHLNLLTSCDAF